MYSAALGLGKMITTDFPWTGAWIEELLIFLVFLGIGEEEARFGSS